MDIELAFAAISQQGASPPPKRELHDYLWGRLDAGERLLALLGLGTGGAKELFTDIVNEEKAAGLVRPSILAERQGEIDGRLRGAGTIDLEAEAAGGRRPELPGPGEKKPTERP